MENDPDIVAMIGASAALTISGLPFLGPIGAARVGYKDGQYLLNPAMDEMAESALDLVVAGTREGVLMVESEAQELTERSEEHTSELKSLMRISYAVFCLKKKKNYLVMT